MKTTITALILALLAVPAWAATTGPAAGGGVMQLDQDRNGSISRQEAAQAPRLQRNFDRLDANRDGQLSHEELPCGGQGPLGADTNKDGVVSRKEADAFRPLSRCFDTLDANKDGQISREEMRAHHQHRHGQRHGHGHGPMMQP